MFFINLCRQIWGWFRRLFPWLKKLRVAFPALPYLLEGLFLIAFLGLLYWFNIGREHFVEAFPSPLRRFFFPLIGLLIYVAFRLLLFILRQLPSRASRYPDIDAAFEAGMDGLIEAGLSLQNTPVFLVIGLPRSQEKGFAEQPHVGGDLCVDDSALPVHWYGNRHGIWITLPGVSAVSDQAARPSTAARPLRAYSQTMAPGGRGATMFGPSAPQSTLLPTASGNLSAPDSDDRSGTIMATLGPSLRTRKPDKDQGRFSLSVDSVADVERGPSQRLTADEIELAQDRLQYFVKLLRKSRLPVCPVNGTILVLPYAWIASDEHSLASAAAAADMQVLQDNLQIRCTNLLVLSEIEQSHGLKEFLRRQDPKSGDRVRIGCGFPPLTYLDPNEAPALHQWLVEYLETQFYSMFPKHIGDKHNDHLVKCLHAFRIAKPAFTRVIRNAAPREVAQPLYFGGLYFAGGDGRGRPAYFTQVLNKLLQEHDETIAWSPQALAADRRLRVWTTTLMIAVVALIIIVAVMLVYLAVGWL